LALGTTLSVLVNSLILAWVLRKDLALSFGFYFNARMGKVLMASAFSVLIVETLLKVEFFTQPFVTKCFYLAGQISAIGFLYISLLMLMGERAAVNALLAKMTKKFRKK
jgi:membrane glycosyltransferase